MSQEGFSAVEIPGAEKCENPPQGFAVSSKEFGETESTLKPGFDREVNKVEGKYEVDVPAEVLAMCQEIKGLGGRALLVGGSVRDAVMSAEVPGLDLKPKDFDLEVFGLSSQTLQNVLETKYGRSQVSTEGQSYQVLKVHVADLEKPVDVSIPRRDSKTGSGHRGFTVTGDPSMTVSEASIRRDLTINSLAYDPLTRTLYDPFNGVRDIRNGIIRATDAKTFQEDPLRVLRVAQFASRFGFNVEAETANLCREMIVRGDLDPRESSGKKAPASPFVEQPDDGTNTDGFLVYSKKEGTVLRRLSQEDAGDPGLPKERITEEVAKLLVKGEKPSDGFEFARQIGFVERYWPQLESLVGVPQEAAWHPEGNVWNHTMQTLDAAAQIAQRENLTDDQKLVLSLAALCHDLGKPETTKLADDGLNHSYGHEKAGVRPTRDLLHNFRFPNDVERQVLALVPDHLAPIEFWKNETQRGLDMKGAVGRLALRLEKGAKGAEFAGGGTTINMLSLLAEADQRGRNGEGGQPLTRDQVPEVAAWQEWLAGKVASLKGDHDVTKSLVTGSEVLEALGLPNGGEWLGLALACVQQDQLDGKVTTAEQALANALSYVTVLKGRVPEQSRERNVPERMVWRELKGLEDPRTFLDIS